MSGKRKNRNNARRYSLQESSENVKSIVKRILGGTNFDLPSFIMRSPQPIEWAFGSKKILIAAAQKGIKYLFLVRLEDLKAMDLRQLKELRGQAVMADDSSDTDEDVLEVRSTISGKPGVSA